VAKIADNRPLTASNARQRAPASICMPDRPLPRAPTVSTVPSPCIRNCCLDDAGICLGCFRSVEEIVAWGTADEVHRRRILSRAAQRKQQKASGKLSKS
jgi:hypothetical protein